MISKALALMMVLFSLTQGVISDYEDQLSLGGNLFLINRQYMITADYVPEDLVRVLTAHGTTVKYFTL